MRLGFSPTTAVMFDLGAAYRLAASLELAFIELSADLYEIMPSLQAPKAVRELQSATGVGATVHLAFVDLNVASMVPAARTTAVERTLRGLDFAHEVGAHCGVLHTGLHYLRHPQVDPLVAAALDATLSAVSGSSVPIVLENLVLTEDDYLRDAAALRDVTRRHAMRNCFDFGHAHVEGTRRGAPVIDHYLETLGDDVLHLHVHNNGGQRDDHRPTSDGEIDYAPYASYLRDFTGTVCLEVTGGEAGIRSSVEHLRGLVRGVS
jgi:sugar phosphate isomerase/epimerase